MELKHILLLSLVWVAIAGYQSDTDDPNHLPTTVTPKRYTIDLTIPTNFHQTMRFTGTVEITVKVHNRTSYIVLNSYRLKYTNSVMVLDEMGNTSIPVTLLNLDYSDRIILTTHVELEPNDYILRFVDYEGVIREDIRGLYLSDYIIENEMEYIVATQFQAKFARTVFPCFDEPKFKAVFALSITRPADYHTLSNTNRIENIGNTDRFRETPLMSTYLLAFVVSKLKSYAGRQQSGEQVAIDVWCTKASLPTAQYAYSIATDLLKQFTTFTRIDYQRDMRKMDLVAMPDLSRDAMGNWGLLTFIESGLLLDEDSTIHMKQKVALTIAHEIAYVWFGNLVTMDWWSHLWLNEGFARYYEFQVTAKLEPTWELEKRFVLHEHLRVMKTDSYDSAIALNEPADTRSEINKKFSSTGSSKAASIIKMLANVIGKDRFHAAIAQYLRENSYGNVAPSHLYKSLSRLIAREELPAGIEKIMSTWTDKPGYPVVMVRRNSSGFILTQKRFSESFGSSPYKWFIPITYTTKGYPNFRNTTVGHWLLPAENLFIPTKESEGWVVVNLLATGFYRVNYEEPLWQALAGALNARNFAYIFPEVNRALIVDDAMNLARTGAISYKTAMTVIDFLAEDTSYYPWYAAFNAFDDLLKRFRSTSYIGRTLRQHILRLTHNLRVSVVANRFKADLKAILVYDWSCKLEEKHFVEGADHAFQAYMHGEKLQPDFRGIVFCTAIRQDQTGKRWRFLWRKYQQAKLPSDMEIILFALGCSKNETILKEYLQLSLDISPGMPDFPTVFKAVLDGNPSNVRIAFDFVKKNLIEIAHYTPGVQLESILYSFAEIFTTEEELDEYDAFLARTHIGKLEAAPFVLAAARGKLRWVKMKTEDLESWLREIYGASSGMVPVTSVLIWGSLVAVSGF